MRRYVYGRYRYDRANLKVAGLYGTYVVRTLFILSLPIPFNQINSPIVLSYLMNMNMHWKNHSLNLYKAPRSKRWASTLSDMPTSTCYWDWPKSNELSNLVPCGDTGSSIQKCCVRGDLCLSDSICHFTHPLVNASGYYNSGCTDETYSDPQACSKHCCKSSTLMTANVIISIILIYSLSRHPISRYSLQ